MGSFPLNYMGLGTIGRTVILPDNGLITLEYPNLNNPRQQVSYLLNSAPQRMQGIFQDLETLSCSFYYQAKFRLNPANLDSPELIVVNGMGEVPVIERYSFNGSAYFLGSAYL
eukprot:TRINITY_DN3767_c0_g2_i1.p1 TRINITY_DN3767_c0_g2~~TRINITY_DN3767_c0_g2_i1.p1  ORF type:complete len:113 (-),score=2.12 TRINITY_DN3767_c0_g2_i1:1419-1757(-)